MFYQYANTIYHKPLKTLQKRFYTHLKEYFKNSKIRSKIKFSLICIQFFYAFSPKVPTANLERQSADLRRFRWFSVKTLRSDTGKNRQTKKPTYLYADFHQYHYSTPCTILYYTLVFLPFSV